HSRQTEPCTVRVFPTGEGKGAGAKRRRGLNILREGGAPSLASQGEEKTFWLTTLRVLSCQRATLEHCHRCSGATGRVESRARPAIAPPDGPAAAAMGTGLRPQTCRSPQKERVSPQMVQVSRLKARALPQCCQLEIQFEICQQSAQPLVEPYSSP